MLEKGFKEKKIKEKLPVWREIALKHNAIIM
jgi:hypothetical protein